MQSSPKNKSLVWIIFFLILTNLAMLTYFVFFNGPSKKPRGREDQIATFLQKDLLFDTVQMRNYENLKDEHSQKAKPLFEGIRSAKDSFYNLLYTNDVNDSLINTRAEMIGNKQRELDLGMFQHLKKIRAICTTEQLTKFDTSFKKVMDKMIGRGKKPKDEKK